MSYLVQQYRAPTYVKVAYAHNVCCTVQDSYVRIRELVHGSVISAAPAFDRKDSRTPTYVNKYLPQQQYLTDWIRVGEIYTHSCTPAVHSICHTFRTQRSARQRHCILRSWVRRRRGVDHTEEDQERSYDSYSMYMQQYKIHLSWVSCRAAVNEVSGCKGIRL